MRLVAFGAKHGQVLRFKTRRSCYNNSLPKRFWILIPQTLQPKAELCRRNRPPSHTSDIRELVPRRERRRYSPTCTSMQVQPRGVGPLKDLTDLPLPSPVEVLAMEQALSSPSSHLVCVAGLKRLHTTETPGNVLTRRCSSSLAHRRANRLYQAVRPPLYASMHEFCLTRIAGYPRRSSTPT